MPGVPSASPPEPARRSIRFDRSRLRWPEWVVAISALVLLLALFLLDWFTFLVGGRGPSLLAYQSLNGWNCLHGLRWLLLVTIILAFALFFFQATKRPPAIPVTLSLFVTALAGASTIWLFVRVVIDPPGGREVGGWVALISAAVLTWAGLSSIRMEGVAPSDEPQVPTVTPDEIAAERARRREEEGGADQPPGERS